MCVCTVIYICNIHPLSAQHKAITRLVDEKATLQYTSRQCVCSLFRFRNRVQSVACSSCWRLVNTFIWESGRAKCIWEAALLNGCRFAIEQSVRKLNGWFYLEDCCNCAVWSWCSRKHLIQTGIVCVYMCGMPLLYLLGQLQRPVHILKEDLIYGIVITYSVFY